LYIFYGNSDEDDDEDINSNGQMILFLHWRLLDGINILIIIITIIFIKINYNLQIESNKKRFYLLSDQLKNHQFLMYKIHLLKFTNALLSKICPASKMFEESTKNIPPEASRERTCTLTVYDSGLQHKKIP
jgi:hypothetical protein